MARLSDPESTVTLTWFAKIFVKRTMKRARAVSSQMAEERNTISLWDQTGQSCLPGGIATAGVTRNDWIGVDRERALRNALCQPLCDQYGRRLSLFYTVFERSESVEICQSGPTGAMVNARNQEQPEEIFRFLTDIEIWRSGAVSIEIGWLFAQQ